MLRHQELLAQKKNELRLLEESISTNKQIIEQQQQQQQQLQLQLQQINHHYKSNKKAKKDKSAVRTMDPEPTTTSPEPQLSNSAETSPDDYVKQQQSESTNRLKPLTQRRLNRIAHMKKKASFSPRPTISDTATTRRVTPEQHCLETINTMSSMSSSTFSSIPKTHISKASVMEFYLKEKLRESSIREFEMMLNNT
jgi:hypothetical protein